jgi:hypothetical protein
MTSYKRLTEEQKQANKEERKKQRELDKQLARVEKEKNQPEVKEIHISIEWKKSYMWGYNPHLDAEVYFKNGQYARFKATCSGYGYDKESTVIADVFNNFLKYKLYKPLVPLIDTWKDYTTGEEKIKEREVYGIYIREDWKSYSGGIGTNCYYDIAKTIGGEFKKVASGKSYDAYVYTDLTSTTDDL